LQLSLADTRVWSDRELWLRRPLFCGPSIASHLQNESWILPWQYLVYAFDLFGFLPTLVSIHCSAFVTSVDQTMTMDNKTLNRMNSEYTIEEVIADAVPCPNEAKTCSIQIKYFLPSQNHCLGVSHSAGYSLAFCAKKPAVDRPFSGTQIHLD
jgi:hypothetical protein